MIKIPKLKFPKRISDTKQKNRKHFRFTLLNNCKINLTGLNLLLSKFGKRPSWQQWKSLGKILSKRERYGIFFFIFLIILSSFSWSLLYYFSNTELIPKENGTYIEGVVGTPQYINPIFASDNDVDIDLAKLVFSGLLKNDLEGKLVPDLAEKFEISSDGKSYTFWIRKNIRWHDGEELSVDDIIFTIQTIQNPDFKSPIRLDFQGVTIEKIDDSTIRFILPKPYRQFINNLTVGILPKHIWEAIDTNTIALSPHNLKPIGNGMYKFKRLKKDQSGQLKSIELEINQDYYDRKPYLKNIIFQFYPDENSLIKAYEQKEIMGLKNIAYKDAEEIKAKRDLFIYTFNIPRIYGIFLNPAKNKILADKNIRLALAYATDKKQIIDEVLFGKANQISSPILPTLSYYNIEQELYLFDLIKANEILEKAGWKKEEGKIVRKKDNLSLQFTLLTVDKEELTKTAQILKSQWENIGVELDIGAFSWSELEQKYIKTRDYDLLLVGEVLNLDTDLVSFWHSSERKDPGLNFSSYSNPEVDKILEDLRQPLEDAKKIELLKTFQVKLNQDIPAIFLYSPNYLYGVTNKIKGIKGGNINLPSDRFSQIQDWYIETKRVWK